MRKTYDIKQSYIIYTTCGTRNYRVVQENIVWYNELPCGTTRDCDTCKLITYLRDYLVEKQ